MPFPCWTGYAKTCQNSTVTKWRLSFINFLSCSSQASITTLASTRTIKRNPDTTLRNTMMNNFSNNRTIDVSIEPGKDFVNWIPIARSKLQVKSHYIAILQHFINILLTCIIDKTWCLVYINRHIWHLQNPQKSIYINKGSRVWIIGYSYQFIQRNNQ